MGISRVLVLSLSFLALHASAALSTEQAAREGAAASEKAPVIEPEGDSEPGATASQPAESAASPEASDPAPLEAANTAQAEPETAEGKAIKERLIALPRDGTDEEVKEAEALSAFYAARAYAPLWMEGSEISAKGKSVIAEIQNAAAWGLDAKDFELPTPPERGSANAIPPEAIAATDVSLSQAVLKYARYARGGRIINPTEQLNSNLDRRPQLIPPRDVLDGIAAAPDAAEYLAGTNPKHEQFVRLRETYLALTADKIPAGPELTLGMKDARVAALRHRLGVRVALEASNGGDPEQYDPKLAAAVIAFKEKHKIEPADGTVDEQTRAALNKAAKGNAKKVQANMEMWRWMHTDLGDMYMIANVPEFMIRLMKGGDMLHTERIVAGEIGKQTTIFTRPLKNIVFRPMWRVPESIKVKELWPSLLKGGGLMRQYGLELETKDGKRLDYHSFDWTKTDIRNYEVVQPPGRKSVLGVVKFSFPSQHTIFMHDTPDKWMFNSVQRTLSHGCLRLRNPVRMAELILAEDKGWDKAKIADLIKSGPLNNEVVMEKKIPMHITYFTQWVNDAGTLKSYPDIYGHEKRVMQALAGKWNEIKKGRDHLAPVALDLSAAPKPQQTARHTSKDAGDDFFSSFFGILGN